MMTYQETVVMSEDKGFDPQVRENPPTLKHGLLQ